MLNSSTSTPGTTALLEASTVLGRCRTQSQVLACIERTLAGPADLSEYDVIWLADGGERSLRAAPASLPAPAGAARSLLADGQIVVEDGVSFIPMVARGLLQGWITVRSSDPVDPLLANWAGHCAAALLLVDTSSADKGPDRERAAIDEIARVVSSTLNLDLLLERIATLVGDLIDAQGFYVALLEEESRELGFAYIDLPPGRSRPEGRWSIDEGLTGIIVQTGEPICTDDYLAECERRGVAPAGTPGFSYARAWLGVPLRHQDQTLGAVVVTHDTPGVQFEASDVRLLSTIAVQAAGAVANAQLYARIQQQASQLALINRVGRTIASSLDPQAVPMLLVRELTGALEVEEARVLIYDPSDGALEVRYAHPDLERKGLRLPPGTGLAHQALRRGEVLIDYDGPDGNPPDAAARAVLCVPLSGRHVKGVIELHDSRVGRFKKADIEFVRAVAEQAAVALENAHLYGQTDEALTLHIRDLEQRNQQLAEVVQIGYTLRSTFNVQGLTDQITQTIHTLTSSPRVLLGLVDAEQAQLRIVSAIGMDLMSRRQYQSRPIPLDRLEAWLEQGEPIGAFTVHVGRLELLPFENAVIMAIHEPRGALIGAIVLERANQLEQLPPDLIQTLEIVANQAGIALNNAVLYTEQQRTVDRLTALNSLSLVVSTTQLSADEIVNMTIAGAVGTTGGESGGAVIAVEGRPVRVYGDGPAALVDPTWLGQRIPREREYAELAGDQIPPELRQIGLQRLLVVPLRGANQTVGTLWTGYTQPTIGQAEREMAVLYAKMAGAVLENLHLAEVVRAAHDRMASILFSTREGMLLIGADGRISIANPALARMLGTDERQLQGRRIDELCDNEVLASLPRDVRDALSGALDRVLAGSTEVAEGDIAVPGRAERDLTWQVLPVRGAAGEQTGALLILRDVTADRQMERLRQDLANMIVHDLRSPLTNMLVSLDLLLKSATGPLNERQTRILSIAASSCHQMLDLVNALLDIRRLEQNKLELQSRPADIADIAANVVERLERIAEDKRVQLAGDLEVVPIVQADLEMIRRVLQNLVDNALKFSPPDGLVRIAAHATSTDELPEGHPPGNWVVVQVDDQGPGVPEEYRKVIFDLFVQAPDGHGQGTGLGLAFCKLAVEAHGGRIWVDSVPGKGSSFRFTLPVAPPPEPRRAGTPPPSRANPSGRSA